MYNAETNIGFTPVYAQGETYGEVLRNLIAETEKLVNWKAKAKINVTIQYPVSGIENVKIKVSNYK